MKKGGVRVFAVPLSEIQSSGVRQQPSSTTIVPPVSVEISPSPPPPLPLQQSPPKPAADSVPPTRPVGVTFPDVADNVHVIANWPYDRLAQPLPPDGRMDTRDQYTGADKAFNAEYLTEKLRRESVLYADLVYRFVSVVAGFTGRGTKAEQFWRAKETGGQALQSVFDNLGELSKITHDAIRTPPTSDIGSTTTVDGADKLRNILRSALNDIDPNASGFSEYATTTARPGATPLVPAQLRPEEVAVAATTAATETERKRAEQAIIFSSALQSQFSPLQPASAAAASSSSSSSGAAVPPPPPPPPPPASLQAQSVVNNPRMMLLKLMFRKDTGSISEGELKAWDAYFYNGRFFEEAKRASTRDERDPKVLLERVRLVRELQALVETFVKDQTSAAGGGEFASGAAWRETPVNIGMIFLADDFRASLDMAYDKVRKVALKEWVPKIDLMTHEQTRTYFAKLVAYELFESMSMTPSRYVAASAVQQARADRQLLLKMFQTLQRDTSGYLYFAAAHCASDNAERAFAEQSRRTYQRATGRYFSDTYSQTSAMAASTATATDNPTPKKPRFGVVSSDRQRANAAAISQYM